MDPAGQPTEVSAFHGSSEWSMMGTTHRTLPSPANEPDGDDAEGRPGWVGLTSRVRTCRRILLLIRVAVPTGNAVRPGLTWVMDLLGRQTKSIMGRRRTPSGKDAPDDVDVIWIGGLTPNVDARREDHGNGRDRHRWLQRCTSRCSTSTCITKRLSPKDREVIAPAASTMTDLDDAYSGLDCGQLLP